MTETLNQSTVSLIQMSLLKMQPLNMRLQEENAVVSQVFHTSNSLGPSCYCSKGNNLNPNSTHFPLQEIIISFCK